MKRLNINGNLLYNADCLDVLKRFPDASVNLILTDLPYMETGNKWDKEFPLAEVCKEFERLVKEDGCIALTGTFKFGVKLYSIMEHLYKYDWIWEKEAGTNVASVNYQPFRIHENVYIFGKGRVSHGTRTPMKYNPQKTEGTPYVQKTYGRNSSNWKGGLSEIETVNESGLRHPKTIQKFTREKGFHPTQKPVSLLEYLIKTYTDERDIVLDATMGSGSTGVACQNTNRKFIGIELNEEYFNIAEKRMRENGEQNEN